jgi:hypothetical protein
MSAILSVCIAKENLIYKNLIYKKVMYEEFSKFYG